MSVELIAGVDEAGRGPLAGPVVAADGEATAWSDARIETRSTHGTGCTLASAIATGLGQGMDLPESIARARAYVRAALELAPGLGAGHGPMGGPRDVR